MLISTLLMSAGPALAQSPPPEDLLEQAQRYRRRGALELGLGGAGLAGGLALFTVGRPSWDVSTESTAVREIRNIAGLGLMIGGFTGVLVSVHSFDRARALKREATLQIAPDVTAAGGGAIRFVARF